MSIFQEFLENSLNKKIKKSLSLIKIDEITDPIFTPGGYLILKIDNIRFIKQNYSLDAQLKKLINFETNRQLNQLSNNYFNKIKKDIIIDEIQ